MNNLHPLANVQPCKGRSVQRSFFSFRNSPASWFSRAGFSLLEVILALAIVALVLAAITPALIGTLRAQRQAARILEPLVHEQLALSMLRDDLMSAPLPNGSVSKAFVVENDQSNGRRGDTLTVFNDAPPPLPPRIAIREPEIGQAVITWTLQKAEDGRGLAWTRSRRANLLATGVVADPLAEVLLDHVAELTLETLSGTTWSRTYNSDQKNGVLPLAVRVTYALLNSDGSTGPHHQVIIDLPMVALDPTQTSGT